MIYKALLVSAVSLAAADVGLDIKLYTSSDCSGTPLTEDSGAALTDAQTAVGVTSHPSNMCIGEVAFGGGLTFMGSCPYSDTDTTQQWDGSSITQQGMRWCAFFNEDCDGQCTSSAIYTAVADWEVPVCKTCTELLQGACGGGVQSIKLECKSGSPRPAPPSPPYAPGEGPSEPCFPSSSIVTKADGTSSRIDALKEGDKIFAATAEGTVTTDTVSLLSIAKPEATGAMYFTIATAAKKNLTLTASHHVPVGAECCSTLKQAKDIKVGETVWAVNDGKTTPTTVASKGIAKARGLHSPVLTNGGFPVVDGVVTSFDSIDKVTLAKHAVAPLLKACKATGTCETFRELFLSAEDRHFIASK